MTAKVTAVTVMVTLMSSTVTNTTLTVKFATPKVTNEPLNRSASIFICPTIVLSKNYTFFYMPLKHYNQTVTSKGETNTLFLTFINPYKTKSMQHKEVAKSKPNVSTAKKPVNCAYKPMLIGAIIRECCKSANISPKQLAEQLGIEHRSSYRLFYRKEVSLPLLLKLSEIVQKNLLLHYHPNVPPLPNPLQAQIDALTQEVTDLRYTKKIVTRLQQENVALIKECNIFREQLHLPLKPEAEKGEEE